MQPRLRANTCRRMLLKYGCHRKRLALDQNSSPVSVGVCSGREQRDSRRLRGCVSPQFPGNDSSATRVISFGAASLTCFENGSLDVSLGHQDRVLLTFFEWKLTRSASI